MNWLLTLMLALMTVLVAGGARGAATQTWTGGGSDAQWVTGPNWVSGTAPVASGDSVIFDANSMARLSSTLDKNYSLVTLTLSNPSGAVTIGGSASLTFTGATGLDMSAATQDLTFNVPVYFSANPQTWTIASGHSVTAGSTVSQTAPAWLYKAGTGTLSLSGAYAGYLSINAGTLIMSGGGTTYAFYLAGGGAGTAATFTQNGGSIACSTTANASSGQSAATTAIWNMTAGTLTGGSGGNWYGNNGGGTTTYNFSGGQLNWLSNIFMPAARGTATMTMGNIAVNINNLAYGLWTAEAATQTINLNSGAALSVGSIGELSNSGGAHGSQAAVVSTFNFNGGTISPRATAADFMQYLDTVNIQDGGAIIDSAGYSITIPRALVSAGTGIGGLTKNGSGTLILSGNNTYTGVTTNNTGVLQIGAGGASGFIASSGITNNASLVYSRSDTIDITNNIAGAGSISANVGAGTIGIRGPINVGSITLTSTYASSAQSLYGSSYAAAINLFTNITTTGSQAYNGVVSIGRGAAAVCTTVLTTTGGGGVTLANGVVSGVGGYWSAGTLTVDTSAGNGPVSLAGQTLTYGVGNLNISSGTGTITLTGGNYYYDYSVFNSPVSVTGGATFQSANQWVRGVKFNDNLSGSGTLTVTLGNGAASSTGSGTAGFVFGSTTTQTASCVIAGSSALTKSSTGTLTLTAANTYSGGTALSAGKLNVNHAAAIGTGALTITGGTLDNTSGSAITLSNNNVENWNAGFTFAGSSDLNTGTGTVNLGASPTSVTISAGNLTLGGTLNGTSQWLYKYGAGTLTANGPLNAYVSTYNGTLVSSGGGTFYQFLLSSGVGGTTSTFTQTGGTLAMATTAIGQSNPNSPANTFWNMTGGTANGGNVSWYGNNGGGTTTYNFSGGTFNWLNGFFAAGLRGTATMTLANVTANINNLGYGLWNGEAATQTVSLNSGAVLSVASIGEFADSNGNHGSQGAVASTFNFNGGTISPRASVANFMQYIDTVNIQDGGAIIDSAGYSITIPRALVSAGTGIGGLAKRGSGTLVLSGNNTYTGVTTISGGTLTVGSANALGTSTLDYNSYGGTLSFGSQTTTTFGGLKGTQSLALLTDSSGAVALTVGNNNSDTTYGGSLSGSGSLAKVGAGTLTLSAGSTHSGGTTLSTGRLNINHAASVGTGTLTLNGGSLDNTSGSPITLSNNNAGNWNNTFTFIGSSALNLGTGTVTLAGDTTILNNGNLTVGGTVNLTGHTCYVNGSGTSTFTGTLNGSSANLLVSGNMNYSGVGGVLNAFRTSRSSPGTFTMSGGGLSVADFWTGETDCGNFTITGGSLTVTGNSDIFLASAGTLSTLTQNGGTLNFGGSFFKGANGAAQTSTVSVAGGVWNQTGTFMTNQRGGGLLTVSGSANMTVGLLALGGWVGDTKVATANLDGGTLSVSAVSEQTGGPGGQGGNGGTTSLFNFNGGSLKPTAANTTFLSNVDAVNVKDGGAVIDTASFNITIARAMLNAGTGGLTKNGAGTLTLSGANTYTGLTTVVSGALMMGSGGSVASAVQVNAGNVFGGSGFAWGAVTVANGATLLPGGVGTAGTLVCGDLTLGSDNITLDVKDTTPGGNNDLVTSTNNLVVNGTTITINPLGVLSSGTYTLFRYTNSLSGSGFDPVLLGNTTRADWTLDTATPNVVSLIVGGTGTVTWRPAVSGDWDIQTSTNWWFGGLPTTFYTLDLLRFDDTGAGTNVINVTTTVSPGNIVVNSASNYTFTGSGAITGLGGLTKSGTGTLTVNTPTDYTAATTVSGGGLTLGAGGAISNAAAFTVSGTPATNARLTLSGGSITNRGGNFIVAATAGALGSVSLNSGSLYITGGDLIIGNNQNNTTTGLWTQVGGAVSVNSPDAVYVGGSGGARGDMRVSGGTFTSVQSIWLMTGNALLTVSNTASVTAPLRLGYYGDGATVNLDGGTLTTGQPDIAGNSGHVFNFNGGTLKGSGATLYWMNGFSTARVKVGGAVLDSNGQTMGMNRELTHDAALGSTVDGGLNKRGAGTVVLWSAASNTYTGPTTISAGTLQIGNNDTTGDFGGPGDITNQASLVFNRTGSLQVTNLITGAGSLTKSGAGTVTLAGLKNYSGSTTVSGGTLILSNMTTFASAGIVATGTLRWDVGTGVTLTYVNGISGGGTLTKVGTGALILNAASSFSGTTVVSAGTLGGTGSLTGALSLQAGATLMPGDPNVGGGIGTLTAGATTLASGGTLTMKLSGATASLLHSTGAVNLNSGTLTLVGSLSMMTNVTIVNGTSVTGKFSGIPAGGLPVPGSSPAIYVNYYADHVELSPVSGFGTVYSIR